MLTVSQRLFLMILGMNVFLWIGGFMGASGNIADIYPWVPEGLRSFEDANSGSLEIIGADGVDINQATGSGSSFSQTTNFISVSPTVGSIFAIIPIVVSFFFNLTFGFIVAFNNMHLPLIISVPLDIILTALVVFGLIEFGINLVAALRGVIPQI